MRNLQALQAFLQVVDSGSFAAAARELGVTRSAVQKMIATLERELGVQLFRRSTRTLSVTDAGSMLHASTHSLLEDLDSAITDLAKFRKHPYGKLRMTAPMSLGMERLAGPLAEFAKKNPDIHMEVTLTDRYVDLIEEGFDIAIRIVEDHISTSVAHRLLADTHRIVCASPEYVEKRGAPSHPNELQSHQCLNFGRLQRSGDWPLSGPKGVQNYPIKCVMWSNNGLILRSAALNGCGLALLPTFVVRHDLENGRLVQLLPDFSQPISILALYARHTHVPAPVQSMLDFLAETFLD